MQTPTVYATTAPRLILASASPARLRTLQAAGIDAEVVVSGVDESTVDATRPEALSGTLARLKAQAVAERLRRAGRGEVEAERGAVTTDDRPEADGDVAKRAGARTLVLGCDSVLAFDGEILGKPGDPAEATKRWQQMRGRSGVLHTGHCVVDMADGRIAEEVAATTVWFAEVSDAEIGAYVATGEPLRVAGAFTIDGLGGPFVERIDGDPGTVIGLSLPLLRRLLARLDVPIVDLWRRPPGPR